MRSPILYGEARKRRRREIQNDWRLKNPDCARRNSRTAAGRYRTARYRARKNDQEFTITLELFSEMVKRPCTYCGYPLRETGSGLDRADNATGYTPSNAVPCCRECNVAKSDYFTFQEMTDVIGPAIKRIKDIRATLDPVTLCASAVVNQPPLELPL